MEIKTLIRVSNTSMPPDMWRVSCLFTTIFRQFSKLNYLHRLYVFSPSFCAAVPHQIQYHKLDDTAIFPQSVSPVYFFSFRSFLFPFSKGKQTLTTQKRVVWARVWNSRMVERTLRIKQARTMRNLEDKDKRGKKRQVIYSTAAIFHLDNDGLIKPTQILSFTSNITFIQQFKSAKQSSLKTYIRSTAEYCLWNHPSWEDQTPRFFKQPTSISSLNAKSLIFSQHRNIICLPLSFVLTSWEHHGLFHKGNLSILKWGQVSFYLMCLNSRVTDKFFTFFKNSRWINLLF